MAKLGGSLSAQQKSCGPGCRGGSGKEELIWAVGPDLALWVSFSGLSFCSVHVLSAQVAPLGELMLSNMDGKPKVHSVPDSSPSQ